MRRVSTLVLAVVLAGVLPTPARADGTARDEHRLSFGLAAVSFGSFFRGTPTELAPELGWGWYREGGIPVEVGGGLRGTLPRAGVVVPMEIFARARWNGRLGFWSPMVGPELGWSGLARLSPREDGLPQDLDRVESQRLGGLYLSFDAAPLRFQLNHCTLSLLEISLGSTLTPVGSAVRMDVGLVYVGYNL